MGAPARRPPAGGGHGARGARGGLLFATSLLNISTVWGLHIVLNLPPSGFFGRGIFPSSGGLHIAHKYVRREYDGNNR